MSKLTSICVYCGSAPGHDPAYLETARRLGADLAKAGIRLIYGGGDVGLMGAVARAVIDNGGSVTGIIPTFLMRRERMLTAVEELIVTADMHERKQIMFERADAFVALPGGVGTLEELVEQLTWAQLGQHKKPIILANTNGFWDRFLDLIGHMHAEGFIRSELPVSYTVVNEAEDIVQTVRDLLAAREAADLEPEVPVTRL
jgi:uncharacterized protein (TIGR00730 family)